MSELGSQIRRYIDQVAPAMQLDDVRQPVPVADARPRVSPSRPGARWLATAAAVACVVVGGAALVVRSSDQVDQVQAGSENTLRTLGQPSEERDPGAAPTQVPEDCIRPPAETSAFLNTLVDDGLIVGPVASYESDDESYQSLFFLSAVIEGGELSGPGEIATWAGNFSLLAGTADSESGSGPSLPPHLSLVPVNELAMRISAGIGPMRVPSMDTDGAVESQECLAATVPTEARPPTASEPESTVPRPEITFTYADGTVGSLEDFVGTPVVLGFVASWCAPCASQLATLQEASDEYGSAVTFVGIRTRDLSADELALGQEVDFTIVADPDGAAHDAVGGVAMPTVVLVDADGQVSRTLSGSLSVDQLLEEIGTTLVD